MWPTVFYKGCIVDDFNDGDGNNRADDGYHNGGVYQWIAGVQSEEECVVGVAGATKAANDCMAVFDDEKHVQDEYDDCEDELEYVNEGHVR